MYNIHNEFISATIEPLGAELVELKKHNHSNVLWEKDPAFWNRIAPNLFPIVGRLKDDCYSFNDRIYSLSQHGFARDLPFEVEFRESDRITLLLKESSNTIFKYPFKFEFRISYVLKDNKITVSYDTRNTGNEVLPYSVGGHPAFSIDDDLSNYNLIFSEKLKLERQVLEGSYFSGETEEILNGKSLALNNKLFEKDAIVFFSPEFDSVTLEHHTKGPIITMRSNNWEALGIWTKPGAPFLCIEPWWGHADSAHSTGNILEKPGIHLLQPGQEESVSYSILIY